MSAQRPPDGELLTPWHWIIAGDNSHVYGDGPWARLQRKNPAAHRALHGNDQSWDAWLGELISQGATDEDILEGGWLDLIASWPVRRYIPERLAELRGQPVIDARTPLARQKIPEVARTYHDGLRRTGKLPSKRQTAQLVGVDRGTLADWIKRGWMTWPPQPPAGS